MKAKLFALAIQGILAVLTPELVKELMDKVLDFIEDKVKGSASTVDDNLVLPMTDLIRRSFDIPDND